MCLCFAATSCAGSIVVHRRVWGPAHFRAVRGRGAHTGTFSENPCDHYSHAKNAHSVLSVFLIFFFLR